MKYNYTQAGGNADTFDQQTLGDILDFILTFIEMNNKKKNPNQKQDNRVKGETETFGRADGKTLEELLMEGD